MRHTHLSIVSLSALAALLFPLSALAVASITAADSIAGLGTTVTITNLAAQSNSSLTLTGPKGTQTLPMSIDAKGNATVTISGTMAQAAGTYTVSVGSSTASFAVLPDTVDPKMSDLQSWTPHIQTNGRDSADIAVTLRDKFGNVLAGRPVALVSSRNSDRITALTPETDKNGLQEFSLTTTQDGTISIRAIDLLSGNTLSAVATIQAGQGGIGGDDQRVAQGSYDPSTGRQFYAQVAGTAAFDVVDHFEVDAPDTLPVGEEAQKVTISAVDKNGNIVQNYVGTVSFDSTDPQATMPNFGTYTFLDRDLGQKSFPLVLSFKTPGSQIFRVQDAQNTSIKGSKTIVVGGGTTPVAHGITVTSYKDGDTVNSLNITISGTGPHFATLTVMGGSQDSIGSTDANGAFSIPVTLPANQHDFTIRVQDDTKQNDSGPIHLIFDNSGPSVGTITFSPAAPNTGDKVLAVVQSEPGLQSVTLSIKDPTTNTDLSVPLTENTSASGSYQGFFTAPAGGVYQPDVVAIDTAGNTSDVRTTLTVGTPGLATVQNVQIEARVNAVALQWDAINDASIDGYRVYVGESADNFAYTIDTGRVTTKATIAGLLPGHMYYFAVTAVKGTIESTQKSAVVSATPLGLTLTVLPGDGTLQVQWTALSTDLPLSGFKLEYGTSEDNLSETRDLNAELRTYTLRDLINGVPYFLKLTPITVTGDKLDDLAAKGQGTPSGNGFHPGPNDPVPGNLSTTPGNMHPAPSNPSSGLPTVAWMGIAVLGLLGAVYGWRRRNAARHTDEFLSMIQSRYK